MFFNCFIYLLQSYNFLLIYASIYLIIFNGKCIFNISQFQTLFELPEIFDYLLVGAFKAYADVFLGLRR